MDPKQEALDNALIRAAHFGDLEGAKKAIKSGANIHARGERPVRAAILNKQRDMIRFLMQLGARITAAEVAMGFFNDNDVADGKKLLSLADSGKFGVVSRRVSITDFHDKQCEGRMFADGSVLALVSDFLGNVHPCVISEELMKRVR
jgi:hypothetical protein